MSPTAGHLVGDSARARLASVVGAFLRIDPDAIDPQMPFALYGLDSVGSVELVAALESELGRELPEWLLLEHPDLESLSRALEDVRLPSAALSQMLADSLLPADIRPPAGPATTVEQHVLLTGATGFLGAYLLRDLLEDTEAEIWCLVRGTDDAVHTRVVKNLERYGLSPRIDDRIHVVSGDLACPNLGLGPGHYQHLSESIDAIYHVGANVNWTIPYSALRHANVVATRELLRLACSVRPKVFHFISSLSVCYATGGPTVVREGDDMLPHVDRLPLGYAQSKCVAESLARHAAARGLPVRIYRPPLIVGDSQSGASNLDDLVAQLVKGCIQMGAAPDLDWTFDAMPIDYVSRAIMRLGRTHQGEIWHLQHPRPRHWRECVLWMNMFGYPVRLLSYPEWQQRLVTEAASPHHALHRLRPFFLRRQTERSEGPDDSNDLTVPELYQEGRRSAVLSDLTRRATAALGLEYPRLDAELFDRYFASYLSRGFLPPPTGRHSPSRLSPSPVGLRRSGLVEPTAACYEDPRFLERLLRRHAGNPLLRVRNVSINPIGSDHSIVSELTSWRRRRPSGLFRCQLTIEQTGAGDLDRLDMVIKAKPSDRDALEVGQTVADMCDEPLAGAFRAYRDRIGLTGNHLRELAIYEQSDDRLQRHLPRCFGTWRDDEREEWGLALEDLQPLTLLNAVETDDWAPPHLDAVIEGLTDIHAVWYGREQGLQGAEWLGEPLSRDRACHLTPLWEALAAHAAPYFSRWAGPSVVRTHHQLVNSVGDWWRALEQQPATLIHNDFSPRNLALRHDACGFRLCAYDWELATLGPPQRDLAEFLCFV
ncbi:MAG: thioester reductase domain-containing protein, partial [Vicinamibacterales bacterium]